MKTNSSSTLSIFSMKISGSQDDVRFIFISLIFCTFEMTHLSRKDMFVLFQKISNVNKDNHLNWSTVSQVPGDINRSSKRSSAGSINGLYCSSVPIIRHDDLLYVLVH